VNRCGSLALLLSILGLAEAGGQTAYTPRPGSIERQSICDAVRPYVVRQYGLAPLPKPIVFKIEWMRVQGCYCNFEAIPLFKDGSYVSTKYMVDIAFNLCLKKEGERWIVIVDLSRTDVPDGTELQTIKRKLPSDFPISLLSPTWRDLLNKSR
jgi:hypothetical protein